MIASRFSPSLWEGALAVASTLMNSFWGWAWVGLNNMFTQSFCNSFFAAVNMKFAVNIF